MEPCISSIPQELHIIRTLVLYIIIAKAFLWYTLCVMICSPDRLMICKDSNAVFGDIPLLSQWIKKPYTIVYGFLVEMAVSEGWRLRLNSIICPSCLRLRRTDTRWTMRFRIPLWEKMFRHKKQHLGRGVVFYGGDGGIRNRVRKFILSAFYERSR